MTPLRFLVRFTVFVLVFLAVSEVWLRYVTPASQQPIYRQSSKTLVYSVDPHAARSGLITEGRIPRRVATWHVNDAGWLSPYQYSKRRPGGALVALLGDSYIEGLSVSQAHHIDVDLHERLGASVPVYAFGLSGWDLEQYVAMARYVRATYDPSLLVVLTGEGDVSASVGTKGGSPHWYHIVRSGSGYREVAPSDIYVVGRKAILAHKSALFCYLRYNAKVEIPFVHGNDVRGAPTNAGADAGAAAGTADSPSAQSERALVEAQLPVARYLVARLCAADPGVPIVFAARGARYLPVGAVSDTPLTPEMEALREACAGHPQCHFLDLRMAFSLDWAHHHEHFEALDGAHYNAHANAVAAQAVADYLAAHGSLSGVKTP